MAHIPHVLCIHDLSCVGRCSLTVILPALSAIGVQASPFPTALLSTHTGGFGAPARTDEAAFCREALAHYRALDLHFDGIYSGYLADAAHAQLVQEAIEQNPDALNVIDPVMADDGKLYSNVTPALCSAICTLCEKADVLCPNVTESAILLGYAPADAAMSHEELKTRLAALHTAYPRAALIIITGAALKNGTFVNALLGPAGPVLLPYTRVAHKYHGTGDLFAAIVTGGLLRGMSGEACVTLAAQFITETAHLTLRMNPDPRLGVVFEPLLGKLANEVSTACTK